MNDDYYLPTPDEIREACARIRAGWSADDHIARRGKCPPMQRSDFRGVEAAAAVKLEDRLAARREAVVYVNRRFCDNGIALG